MSSAIENPTTQVGPVSPTDTASAAKPHHGRHWFKVGMRWKLMTTFAGAFTIVFVFIAIWVLQFATNTAQARLDTTLRETSIGGASTLNAAEFETLLATVPSVPDPENESGLGYPDSPLFDDIAQSLLNIYLISGNQANPYTYFKDPVSGELLSAVSAGAALDPRIGISYQVPYSEVVNEETYKLMEQGLVETTSQAAYTDAFGSWISSYTPITNADGVVIGALGVDFPIAYVDEVRSDAQRKLIPVLVGTYLLLLVVVLVIASTLTRPLKRLNSATRRIADGEYDLDVRGLIKTRFPDEMSALADSFAEMASKVAQREQSLKQEVTRLKVEIDHARRTEAVKQITESEGFSEIIAKAAEMRKRLQAEE